MKILTLILAVLSAALLSSCNTMSGLGRDMQQAGSSLESTAERTR